MADRVSTSITIGGRLPSTLLPEFIALIEQEGLSTEWDGEPFTVHDLPESGGLDLMAHEVAWGRFEALEAFCVKNALPFSRWSGAYPSQWGAERVVFSGSGDPVFYAAAGHRLKNRAAWPSPGGRRLRGKRSGRSRSRPRRIAKDTITTDDRDQRA